ncbi:MAG TPA: response regulator [Thermoanaerobaculia bacterium]|jgi:DNA-binding response OmpR family regulator|nr:response regulator [Thermoanaerobaculia bacterium]
MNPLPILIVEDDQPLRSLLTALLSQHGYTFESIEDGRAAIDRIRRKPYAAILLDLMLPDTNGFEVIDYVRAEKPSLMPSIIVITAASRHTLHDFDASTIGALVRKPFDIHLLIETIDAITGRERPAPHGGETRPRTSAYLAR